MALRPIADPADWSKADVTTGTGWRHHLAAEDISALRAMAADVRPALNDDANALISMDKSHFDLGNFAPKLARIYGGLKDGLGIALIKGLPVDCH